MDLHNKNIVITGTTGGIGRELVGLLDGEGATLILIARSEDELRNQAKDLKSECQYFACDFTNQKKVEVLARQISKKFKTIDILINAAGVGIYKDLEEETLEEWNNSMNINVTSQFILIKNLIKRNYDFLEISLIKFKRQIC